MWLVLVMVALATNMVNVVGYYKCRKDAGRKLTQFGGSVLTRGLEVWSSAQTRMRGGSERLPTQG